MAVETSSISPEDDNGGGGCPSITTAMIRP